MQRDGIVDSLFSGFKAIDTAVVFYGWSGFLEEDIERVFCFENGLTYYEDLVEESQATTYIEIYFL
jgi:hypothetical protein